MNMYTIFINTALLPMVLAVLGYVWKDVTNRVKSIEDRTIRIEKDIVRISTILESLEKWNPLIIVKHARFVTCSMLAKIMQKKIKYNLFFCLFCLYYFMYFHICKIQKCACFFTWKLFSWMSCLGVNVRYCSKIGF